MKLPVPIMSFGIAVALSGTPAIAATSKCKYEQNDVDPNSQARIVITEPADLSHPIRPNGREMTGFVAAISRGEQKSLGIQIEYLRPKKTFPTQDDIDHSIAVPLGGELLIGMADGSVVTLYSTAAVTAETEYETPEPYSGGDFWLMSKANIEYALDDVSMAALLANEASAIRVITAAGKLDVRIYSGGTDNIQKAISCLAGGEK